MTARQYKLYNTMPDHHFLWSPREPWQQLTGIWEEVHPGESWTLQVSGESGVGKTWLLRSYLLIGCESEKWWRLNCGEVTGLAEQLITSILTRYPGWRTIQGISDEMISILRYHGTDPIRQLLSQNTSASEIEPLYFDDDFQETAWQLITSTLDKQGGALRVWVEDLHLADNVALSFLEYLRTNSRKIGFPLNLVFTTLNNGINASGRDFIRSVKPDFKLRLTPWDAEDVTTLMQHDYGVTMNKSNHEFAAKFYQQVGGVPFQVTQTLAYLQEDRILVEKKTPGWGVRNWRKFQWPSSLEEVLEKRLAGIAKHTDSWQVLTALSLTPDPDNTKAIELTLGLSSNDLSKQFSLLYYNGFLDRDYRLRQPVIRDTVLKMLSKDEKDTIPGKLSHALRRSYYLDVEV